MKYECPDICHEKNDHTCCHCCDKKMNCDNTDCLSTYKSAAECKNAIKIVDEEEE